MEKQQKFGVGDIVRHVASKRKAVVIAVHGKERYDLSLDIGVTIKDADGNVLGLETRVSKYMTCTEGRD